VGKIAEKAVCGSVFLTTWHCILSTELEKRTSSDWFFGDFAHWVTTDERFCQLNFSGEYTKGYVFHGDPERVFKEFFGGDNPFSGNHTNKNK